MFFRLLAIGSTAIAAPLWAQATQSPPAVAAFMKADNLTERNQSYTLHAGEGDLYEIEASRLALQRSRDPQLRLFARAMVAHHTRTYNELARIVGGRGAARLIDISEPKSQMIDRLRSTSTDEFDAIYVRGQIAAHQEALALHRAYLSKGRDARLRKFAERAAPIVQTHLTRAKKLRITPR